MPSNVTKQARPDINESSEWVPVCYIRILVGVAFLIGLLLRLNGLSYPPYDSHSFRQTQTLSTIEAFHADGIDLLHPRTLYMGYPGVFILELPLFQAFAAFLYDIFGQHLEIVRLLNILFGAITTWLLFKIVAHLIDRTTAILSALIYWLAPLNILYHRSMLLDPMAVLCGVTSFYFLMRLLAPSSDVDYPSHRSVDWGDFILFGVATWLTAMIKALYLWPSVLLFAKALVERRFQFDRQVLRVLTVFVVAGISFIAWNYYAAQINNASSITHGVKPTSLLGISALLSLDYYRSQLISRPRWWLGWVGALAYPIGIWATVTQERRRAAAVLLLAIIPPTYLFFFANINRPHDYYQLVITPFLAVPAALGLRWIGSRCIDRFNLSVMVRSLVFTGALTAFLVISVMTYCRWLALPGVDRRKVRFQELCSGKVDPGSPAMIFVSRKVSGAPSDSYIPEYVYASKLWGYGKTVDTMVDARSEFEAFSPAFQRLEYIVFYGTECPQWLPKDKFHLMISDNDNQLYIFRNVKHH